MLLQNVVLDDSTLQVLDDCVRVLDDSLPVLYGNFGFLTRVERDNLYKSPRKW